MDNTEKILDDWFKQNHTGLRYKNVDEAHEMYKQLIVTLIDQAVAEERARVRKKVERLPISIVMKPFEVPPEMFDIVEKNTKLVIEHIKSSLLSSLDKPLTDKEIEEMPQMKGTLEALDKLTIIKE